MALRLVGAEGAKDSELSSLSNPENAFGNCGANASTSVVPNDPFQLLLPPSELDLDVDGEKLGADEGTGGAMSSLSGR